MRCGGLLGAPVDSPGSYLLPGLQPRRESLVVLGVLVGPPGRCLAPDLPIRGMLGAVGWVFFRVAFPFLAVVYIGGGADALFLLHGWGHSRKALAVALLVSGCCQFLFHSGERLF